VFHFTAERPLPHFFCCLLWTNLCPCTYVHFVHRIELWEAGSSCLSPHICLVERVFTRNMQPLIRHGRQPYTKFFTNRHHQPAPINNKNSPSTGILLHPHTLWITTLQCKHVCHPSSFVIPLTSILSLSFDHKPLLERLFTRYMQPLIHFRRAQCAALHKILYEPPSSTRTHK